MPMKRLTFLCCLLAVGYGLPAPAQHYYDAYFGQKPGDELPYWLLNRPQSLDDFIGRFNGQHNAYGQPLDDKREPYQSIAAHKAYFTEFRRRIIGSLMASHLHETDSTAVAAFARAAAQSPPLHFLGTPWKVVVPLQGLWMGKPLQLQLHLRPVADQQQRVRWAITDAVFDAGPPALPALPVPVTASTRHFLPPSAHDNGFIALQRLLKKERDLSPHILQSTRGLEVLQYLLQHTGFAPTFKTFTAHFAPADGPAFQLNPQWQITGF